MIETTNQKVTLVQRYLDEWQVLETIKLLQLVHVDSAWIHIDSSDQMGVKIT